MHTVNFSDILGIHLYSLRKCLDSGRDMNSFFTQSTADFCVVGY